MNLEPGSNGVRACKPRLREGRRIGCSPGSQQLAEFSGEQRRDGLGLKFREWFKRGRLAGS
jgi:hypothetical protein